MNQFISKPVILASCPHESSSWGLDVSYLYTNWNEEKVRLSLVNSSLKLVLPVNVV